MIQRLCQMSIVATFALTFVSLLPLIPTQTVHSAPSRAQSRIGALRKQMLVLMNRDRAAHGLYAYVENRALSRGAYIHSRKMGRTGFLTHRLRGEFILDDRIRNDGITTTAWGENVGYASPQPNARGSIKVIERSMLAEDPPDDGHRRNILSTMYSRVGIGVYVDLHGWVWVTEDFAR